MSSVTSHNVTVLRKSRRGDRIEFQRGQLYSHWAIYIGNGKVIHLSGINDGVSDGMKNPSKSFTISGKQFSKAEVKIDSFIDVAADSNATINNRMDDKFEPLSPEEIVSRAMAKLGEVGYNVLTKNCEHFASWCRYNSSKSKQADNLIDTALTIGAIGGALLALVGIGRALASSKRQN